MSTVAPPPSLDDIRACFEGAIPAQVATCARDGTPNVAYISQVYYVDDRHMALSFQFFNKTRQNILANPYATALLLDPVTVAFYRLQLRYLRTETSGALFERMKAQLSGIASHSGIAGVFRLLGSDVYEVESSKASKAGAWRRRRRATDCWRVCGARPSASPHAARPTSCCRRCSRRSTTTSTCATRWC
jgi:hypothetical protein